MNGDQASGDLQGRRVLIVEDGTLLAMELQSVLEEKGCDVLGPVNTVQRALALLEHERPDAALLDLDLDGQLSTPVASALSALHVPFIIVSGYGVSGLAQPELRAASHIDKPVDHRVLVQVLSRLCARRLP